MIQDKRKKKKKRKRILTTLLVILLLLALSAFIILKVFVIKKVEVEGNQLYADEQIKEWVLNDEYSWNTLYVFLKYRFFETQEVPFIDTMEIRINTPDSIGITVYEKGMLGYLYMDSIGQNIYFDKDGFVVETSTEIIEGVPKIKGLTCKNVVLYEKLDLENKKVLKTLLAVTQTLKKYELVPDAINYADSNEIRLTYGTITINLGSSENLTEKIKRLDKIMPKLDGLSGTLHLEEWTEETTDITFEKQ